MKINKLLYIVLILSCSFSWMACNSDGNSFSDKVEAQKNKKLFPFSDAHKVEVFSYKSKDETDNSFSLLLRDHLNNPEQLNEVLKANKLNIKERIVLQPKQIQELAQILYSENCKEEITGNCSTARHGIIFFDKNDVPIAITEISFDCLTVTLSKNFTKFHLCDDKSKELRNFFQQIGITYFEEPIL